MIASLEELDSSYIPFPDFEESLNHELELFTMFLNNSPMDGTMTLVGMTVAIVVVQNSFFILQLLA